jgi:hypothetical protein
MSNEIDVGKRMGFSEELLKDCGPESPADNRHWLPERRRTPVPPGEFWFFLNTTPRGSEEMTRATIEQEIRDRGQRLFVRLLARC